MSRRTRLPLVVAAIPAIALTFAVPFVNRDDPHVFGLPFIFAWIIAWIVVTPPIMWVVHRFIEGRR
ncbi:MAG TPA: DUF3311 domain-containing protein [Candidatus Eremiobacteraceae bacterium]|nr:DUF3311 domain-containing protein [Candidatus Eremiobacteraceae bacterium]